ncbi:S-formylglutathione hydrolase FrmB [Faunimonas pinastri]|uniref:S-formylglutathione hydrolase FrmB n=1 Tax=Faunimonas pinastri TaxID=1855383 RepID=A0A1H9LDB8_9HYPH|nr:alpha/beta hydrolase-fold protein [Faunimonas pinastri]SER09404.1 S-formylglutathione hydrolase FrmB [Faunimonas pinastri]
MRNYVAAALSAILLAALPGAAFASGHGRVEEHLQMPSKILSKAEEFSVYLPPDYDRSKRSYPIVYLMHGGEEGEDADWFRFGKIEVVLDDLIDRGVIPPVIAVSPDGRRNLENKNNTYYMNDADGQFRWEDMFVQEFVPYVESQYRAIGTKPTRSILGLSMGGYAALAYSMRHPELFKAAVAMSAAYRTDPQIVTMDQAGYDRRYGKAWGMGLKGQDRINADYRKYSVLDMVDDLPAANVKATDFYIDCGSDDKFFDGNVLLHEKLRDMGVKHRFMVREGSHEWNYWRSGVRNGLIFIGAEIQK